MIIVWIDCAVYFLPYILFVEMLKVAASERLEGGCAVSKLANVHWTNPPLLHLAYYHHKLNVLYSFYCGGERAKMSLCLCVCVCV